MGALKASLDAVALQSRRRRRPSRSAAASAAAATAKAEGARRETPPAKTRAAKAPAARREGRPSEPTEKLVDAGGAPASPLRSLPAPSATRAHARAAGQRRRRARGGAPRFVIHEHDATHCTGICAWSATACSSPGRSPRGCRPRPKVNHFAAAHRGSPARVPRLRGRDPARAVRRRARCAIWDRGTYECLKWEPRKVEVALHGERIDARYALFAIGTATDPATG